MFFSKFAVKKSLVLTIAIAMSLLFIVSCSDSGDDPGQSVEISGDSALRIDNGSEWDATVYFDGDYIGSVNAHSIRDWDVPVGTHTVMVDNAEEDNSEEFEETAYFEKGMINIMHIDWIEVYDK